MKGFCLEVSGPYACFTRPEMKVERVSYDVITPSAARAIFDAILWKPAIFWRIRQIDVLAPIRWISVRRNEVGAVASPRASGLFIEEQRQQRAGLFLRDVKYRLHAEFDYIPPDRRGKVTSPVPEFLADATEAAELRADESPAKYAAMFERRAKKGQCFTRPYLGCREFAADFRLVDPGREPAAPIPDTVELGWMLYDMDFTNPGDPKPMFFKPRLERGVIRVPDRGDPQEVRR
ncbi:MAG TPA: type I-C CRISPR-associated protein Cas5c [Candidatus Aminicenantes bacterium]|nr:type I-C CRISPR-associated protein Cas5c [Candidatus Aminicenantes bacterium]